MSALDLGRHGVWRGGPRLTPALAAHLERLGFGTVWVGSSPAADLVQVESLIAATERIVVATGIVNIWSSDAAELAASYHRIEQRHPGRLLVGVGAGHPESAGERARRPYAAVVEYLDVLDREGVPVERRALAALGPRMLRLARDRSLGAHPYLVTPAHTREARTTLGAGPLLAPEQRVVLRADPAEARAIGRPSVDRPYLGLSNYLANLRRLGFGDDDLASPGSDRLIDELLVFGDDATIRRRLDAHLDAGADHVAAQLLTADGDDIEAAFARLAVILGLG